MISSATFIRCLPVWPFVYAKTLCVRRQLRILENYLCILVYAFLWEMELKLFARLSNGSTPAGASNQKKTLRHARA